jgi:phosphate transport system substrate-binding protein
MKIKALVSALGFASAVVTLSVASGAAFAGAKLDANLPVYQKSSGVSGNLSSVGSDTLANLMTLWAEEFKRAYPNVNIQIQAAGSSTAPPALTEATSTLGPMSRKMKSKEVAAFEKRYGYKPTAIPVAIDALAVYVHKDNPIKGMTIADVDAVFSSTRKCGGKKNVKTWGDLDMKGSWKNRGIQIYGRNSVSGTYGYFKKKALCKGDYKNNVNEQPGSASVVQSISSSLNGIGYSGIGYKTSGVKAVPLAKKPGKPFVAATPENAVSKKYPLSRFLYVYVNKHPNKPIKLVLSRSGQQVVIKDGYIPLPNKVVNKALNSIK